MDYIELLGIMAGILTTTSFIPQVLHVLKTKSTKDISLSMFTIFSSGVFCWLIYGILKHSPAMIMSNAFVFVLASIILILKIRYK
jgi:MtN3 and saliva related transmembrane protein